MPVQLIVDDVLSALQNASAEWRSKFKALQVIGVVGSVGKTTTKESIYALLNQNFCTLKSEGNLNNEIGLPLTLLRIKAEHEYLVAEMGMYTGGEIALLCKLAQPNIGVVTLIGQVHLSRVGSMEALIAAKRELVEALPENGIAILNADDAKVMGMAPFTKAKVLTYGLSAEADIRADHIESAGLNGISFTLSCCHETVRVHSPLLGRHSVHTALRAAAVGRTVGLSAEAIVKGLTSHRDQLRLLTVRGPGGSIIIDDTYNASPASTLAALNLLNDLGGRRIAVLGDMLELGSAETEGHKRVGRRAAQVAYAIVAIGGLGRIIGTEAIAMGMNPARVHFAENAQEAIPLLSKGVFEGDIILVKGSRGARLDRIVSALMIEDD